MLFFYYSVIFKQPIQQKLYELLLKKNKLTFTYMIGMMLLALLKCRATL